MRLVTMTADKDVNSKYHLPQVHAQKPHCSAKIARNYYPVSYIAICLYMIKLSLLLIKVPASTGENFTKIPL